MRRRLPSLASDDHGPGAPAVWTHLRACPRCRAELSGFRAARNALRRAAAAHQPGEEFFASLEQATLRALAAAPPPGRSGGRRWAWVAASTATACVLTAVLVARFAGQGAPPGHAALHAPARPAEGARILAQAPRYLVPAGFTPSRQGLKGQQMSRDPFDPAPGLGR